MLDLNSGRNIQDQGESSQFKAAIHTDIHPFAVFGGLDTVFAQVQSDKLTTCRGRIGIVDITQADTEEVCGYLAEVEVVVLGLKLPITGRETVARTVEAIDNHQGVRSVHQIAQVDISSCQIQTRYQSNTLVVTSGRQGIGCGDTTPSLVGAGSQCDGTVTQAH